MIGGDVSEKITKGEHLQHIIKRHPIGLVPIYLFVVVGTAVVLVVIGGMLIGGSGKDNFIDIPDGILGIAMILILIFVLVTALIGRQVYWDNELLVTDENLIQVLRPTLLKREVSQLNLAKIQDVTVYQKGFFQMTFNYGSIVIETAGEVASYHFNYAPNPNELAAKIILAHDEYIAKHGIAKQFLSTP